MLKLYKWQSYSSFPRCVTWKVETKDHVLTYQYLSALLVWNIQITALQKWPLLSNAAPEMSIVLTQQLQARKNIPSQPIDLDYPGMSLLLTK